MEYEKCKICGKFGWVGSHKCHPLWEVNIPSYDEDYWSKHYARDANSAAALAAEEYDVDDHPLLDGEEIVVVVREIGKTKTQRFTCFGQVVPEYWAEEVG